MKKGILVADDDPAIRRLIAAVVEGEGFSAIEACDGKEAYRVIKSEKRIAVAIVDIMMPYIEGTELARYMSTDERFRQIPVIIMTADVNPAANSRSLKAGASAFISKPFSNLQLRTIIRTLVPSASVKQCLE